MTRKKLKRTVEKQRGPRPKPNKPILSYEAWWAIARKKYSFQPYMKEILYNQFKARSFLANGRFDEGLADFGIKI